MFDGISINKGQENSEPPTADKSDHDSTEEPALLEQPAYRIIRYVGFLIPEQNWAISFQFLAES